MSGDLRISISFNADDSFVETYQIPYDTTWADFEALLKAQFDCERISVSYIDSDNDEIALGSQDELFEAFRVAMASNDMLSMKVMSLAAEAAVFRISDDLTDSTEGQAEDEPLVLREICPDPSVAIPMPDTVSDKVESQSPAPQGPMILPSSERQGLADLTLAPIAGIVFPDSNLQLGLSSTLFTSQPKDEVKIKKTEVSLLEKEDGQTDELKEDKGHQVLQYSDFVSFMNKLKKDLRTEIVRDVTRKTVKHVLKGLDGAVIESLQGAPGLGSRHKGPQQQTMAPVIHHGVICDGCSNTIEGVRYRCGNCVDFDLCQDCEDKPYIHDPDHVFLKLRRPLMGVGIVDGARLPLLKYILYRTPKPRRTKLVVPIPGEDDDGEFSIRLDNELKSLHARREEKRRIKDERKIEKLKKKEEKLKRRMDCRPTFPMKREKLELLEEDKNTVRYDFYKLLMSAQFLHDESVPDGTQLQPGTKFVKIWRMKNDGDGHWTDSTKLQLLWGNIQTATYEVAVPHVAPGEEGVISVEFVSPDKPGEYQSHWKLYEHGMQFGARVWCSIVVVERETLEPPTELKKESLKIVDDKDEGEEEELKKETAEQTKQLEITFRPTKEEHLRAVSVKNLEPVIADKQEPVFGENLRERVQLNWVPTTLEELMEPAKQEVVQEPATRECVDIKEQVQQSIDTDDSEDICGKQKVDSHEMRGKEGGESLSDVECGGGFVMYDRAPGEEPVVEVMNKDKSRNQMECDLSTAVARLSLDTERKDGATVCSMTPTPTNTPFDVTPLKTPNPEPEDETEDQCDMKPISNSSSVEFVAVPDGEDHTVTMDTMTEYIQQRMAGLDLKPDIDLESVSSYSDDGDDDSSLSDSDYIIVPMPDCFDISRPFMSQSILSSYSTSTVDRIERDFSLEDSHLMTNAQRSSRAVSVDDILSTSGSLSDRPLSPTLGPVDVTDATSDIAGDKEGNPAPSYRTQEGATGTSCDGQDAQKELSTLVGMTAVEGQICPQAGEISADITGAEDGVTSHVTMPAPEGITNQEPDCGAASANMGSATGQTGELTEETQLASKEPISASAQLQDNVRYIKKKSKSPPPKSVDFAPEFANQLVATAVNAAGQAYITAKAVFKTWQDKQAEAKQQSLKASLNQTDGSNKPSQPQGWKPASTQWSPPDEDHFTPPTSQWKPPTSDFKPPQSNFKPPQSDFRPPKSGWTPPAEDYKPPAAVWKPPKEEEKPKPTGPMEKLFDMGFFNSQLNRDLLNKYDNDLERVVRELLNRENTD